MQIEIPRIMKRLTETYFGVANPEEHKQRLKKQADQKKRKEEMRKLSIDLADRKRKVHEGDSQ